MNNPVFIAIFTSVYTFTAKSQLQEIKASLTQ